MSRINNYLVFRLQAFIHQTWTKPLLEQIMEHFHVGIAYPAPIIDASVTARHVLPSAPPE